MSGLNDLALYLKKELDTNERLMEIVRTPLMLSMLIEILKSEGTIPRNEGKIIGKFIKSIYKREKIEKKDANFNQQAIFSADKAFNLGPFQLCVIKQAKSKDGFC